MQSNLDQQVGAHVAIIMDGNGRWALRRGLPRSAGHEAGIEAMRRIIEAAPDLGIGVLTLFAFSSDNWRRPHEEVSVLMSLLRRYLRAEAKRLVEARARLTVIGRRDRLPEGLGEEIAAAEHACAGGDRLHLQVAVDYSARQSIANAAAGWLADGSPSGRAFGRLLAWQGGGTGCDVDLLIRAGGEKRLSDFLLWESAYAELCFVDTMWPDFAPDDLRAAMADYRRRERRFGGLEPTTRPALGSRAHLVTAVPASSGVKHDRCVS